MFLSDCVLSQPSAYDGEILQIKGKWEKHSDINVHYDSLSTSGQSSLELKKVASVAELLKQACPDPGGIEAAWYSSINQHPIFNGAPASYSLNSLYKSYYFNTNLNKILLGSETGTWIYANINNFGWFLDEQGEWLIDGKPTKLFSLLQPDGEWNGLPVYKKDHWEANTTMGQYKDRAVLLTRNGRLPYIPITQKQYLLALKQKWTDQEKETIVGPAQWEEAQKKNMETIRNNKNLTAEMKEKIIADIQKQLDQQQRTRDASIQKSSKYYDDKIKIIDQYLATHPDQEMQQPVITATVGEFTGHFGPDGKKTLYHLVRIDPSYFDTRLPRQAPQFIVLYWRCDKNTASIKFIEQFETNFPISKLTAMLDGEKKDENELNDMVVKGPDMVAIRKKAGLYADSVLKKNHPVFTPPFNAMIPKDTSSGYKIPPRNERMLGAIPAKDLSPSELKLYLDGVEKKYTALLLEQGWKLPDVSSLSAGDISFASTLYLLDGASEYAAWCAFKAAEKDPENILILSNAGGVLNACGFQPVAIPVLQTALNKSPGNSTIQNNIGQSYMALGDVTKAGSYLQQSLSSSPYHPHANFSMACIEYAKGNKSSALSYVQKSLRGSFTDGAMHMLYKLKPDARLWDLLKDHYKPTDYFNEDKYHLPPQCENVSDVERLKAEYKAYREMVERVKKGFDDIYDSENELGKKSMIDKIKNYKTSGVRTAPFSELGAMMVKEISLRLADEQPRLGRAQTIYHKEIAELYDEYNKAYSRAESCAEKLELGNKYMQAMANVTTEYQKTWLPVYKEYFNDYGFWGRVQTADKHFQRAAYADAARGYLSELLQLAETHFLNLCDPEADLKKEEEDYVIKEPDCGIDIGLNLGIGSFRIDCEKMEYHFGGLLVADVVHSYRDHSTTIAIGAGLDLKFGGEKLKAGPIQGGFGATGKMQYFLTFDGTRPSDQGFIWEGAVQYEQNFNTELGTGIKKIDEVKTNSVDLSAKTILSVHNGFTSSGSLYEHLDKILDVKPETQVNKNIKIFNSPK